MFEVATLIFDREREGIERVPWATIAAATDADGAAATSAANRISSRNVSILEVRVRVGETLVVSASKVGCLFHTTIL